MLRNEMRMAHAIKFRKETHLDVQRGAGQRYAPIVLCFSLQCRARDDGSPKAALHPSISQVYGLTLVLYDPVSLFARKTEEKNAYWTFL